MTEADAHRYECLVDRMIEMADLPDGKFLWAAKEQVDGEWAVVVREGQEEE